MSGPGSWVPSRPGRTAAGFTLMEMLVTLMLVSFATMLMFQMLGSYRIGLEMLLLNALFTLGGLWLVSRKAS